MHNVVFDGSRSEEELEVLFLLEVLYLITWLRVCSVSLEAISNLVHVIKHRRNRGHMDRLLPTSWFLGATLRVLDPENWNTLTALQELLERRSIWKGQGSTRKTDQVVLVAVFEVLTFLREARLWLTLSTFWRLSLRICLRIVISTSEVSFLVNNIVSF